MQTVILTPIVPMVIGATQTVAAGGDAQAWIWALLLLLAAVLCLFVMPYFTRGD